MCIFCKVVNKEIPAHLLFEDDDLLAFFDFNPAAPTHVLVIPKRHVVSLGATTEGDERLLGRLLLAARRVAEATGISETGYRTVINTGAQAGQSVFHLHMHVLGGRGLSWPPG
ncbi:MAG TPA: histidine triad nucleotide-binding protein [Isosphaeraceae bacterium]|jgi:histidine triad (HIT) family protein